MGVHLAYLEQLFITRSYRYFALTLTVFVLVLLFCGCLWSGNERQEYHAILQQHAQLRQQLAIMQEKDNSQPVTVVPKAPLVAPVVPIFSVVEILRQSHGRLIHWQPDALHARLELSLAWENVPFFFEQIANYRGLNLASFHITAVPDSMAVILVLEFSYENL